MIGKKQVSNHNSPGPLEPPEIAQTGVYAVKGVAKNIHGQIVQAVSFDTSLKNIYDLWM